MAVNTLPENGVIAMNVSATQVNSVSYWEHTGSVTDIHVFWDVYFVSTGKYVPVFRRSELLLSSGSSSLGRVKPEYSKEEGNYLPVDKALQPHKTAASVV
jgi:hypothetical protein